MMTGLPWGFWEWERIVLQIVVGIFACGTLILAWKIWRQGEATREAREMAIKKLDEKADALAARAMELQHIVSDHDASLFDCEKCEIRKEWIALQSDRAAATLTDARIRQLAVAKKRRHTDPV